MCFFPPVLEVIWHQLSDSLWGTWADREVSNRRAAAGVVQGVGCQDQRVGLESSAQHVLGFSAVKCHGLQALKHHKLVYCLYNWLIYSLKWWFSIVMLVYQRVVLKILVGGLEHLDYFSIYIYTLGMSSSQLTHTFRTGRYTTNQIKLILGGEVE